MIYSESNGTKIQLVMDINVIKIPVAGGRKLKTVMNFSFSPMFQINNKKLIVPLISVTQRNYNEFLRYYLIIFYL